MWQRVKRRMPADSVALESLASESSLASSSPISGTLSSAGSTRATSFTSIGSTSIGQQPDAVDLGTQESGDSLTQPPQKKTSWKRVFGSVRHRLSRASADSNDSLEANSTLRTTVPDDEEYVPPSSALQLAIAYNDLEEYRPVDGVEGSQESFVFWLATFEKIKTNAIKERWPKGKDSVFAQDLLSFERLLKHSRDQFSEEHFFRLFKALRDLYLIDAQGPDLGMFSNSFATGSPADNTDGEISSPASAIAGYVRIYPQFTPTLGSVSEDKELRAMDHNFEDILSSQTVRSSLSASLAKRSHFSHKYDESQRSEGILSNENGSSPTPTDFLSRDMIVRESPLDALAADAEKAFHASNHLREPNPVEYKRTSGLSFNSSRYSGDSSNLGIARAIPRHRPAVSLDESPAGSPPHSPTRSVESGTRGPQEAVTSPTSPVDPIAVQAQPIVGTSNQSGSEKIASPSRAFGKLAAEVKPYQNFDEILKSCFNDEIWDSTKKQDFASFTYTLSDIQTTSAPTKEEAATENKSYKRSHLLGAADKCSMAKGKFVTDENEIQR